MGRICAVPHCYTGYRKCTEKVSLYKVPVDDYFLTKWQEAIAREDRPITPKDYVCRKHFKDDDILQRRFIKDVVEEYQRPKLKPDAIPSIFPDLPEYILKMTKKRRKITIPNESSTISSTETDKDKIYVKNEPGVDQTKQEYELEGRINVDEIEIKTEDEEFTFSTKEEIIEEYDCNGAKLFHCDECSYKTKFSHNLRTHKTKHLSGDDAFMSCELCISYKTKWEITYVNHMKSKHGIILKESWKCPFCLFKTKNKTFLSKHCEKEHTNTGDLQTKLYCEYEGCEYQTESKALLNIHSFTHESDKLENYLSNSLDTHTTSSNNIETKHFDKSINTQSQLSTPNKRKQYFNCSRCPYRSHTQTLLDKHVMKHVSNKSLLNCDKCEYTATCKITLNNHKNNTFHCNECLFTSTLESEYLKHLTTHKDIFSSPSGTSDITIKKEMTSEPNFSLVLIKEEQIDGLAFES